jgi:hypothetical protein
MRLSRSLPLVVALAVLLLGALAATTFASVADSDSFSGARRSREVMSGLIGKYFHLDDVRVTFGTTPKGHEAVAYYTDGEIVVSSTHSVDVETILAHEIWHIIDWRDNGRLDWGEDLPPDNAADYRL